IIAIGLGLAVAGGTRVCANGMFCSEAMNILEVFGVLSAGACLLVVWLYCRLLERLVRQPSGWDRYWLALSLIAMIGIGEGLRLMGVGGMLDVANAEEARLVIQITLVYLASTLLFRIYPQPVPLAGSTRVRKPQFDVLTEQDRHIALKVRELMDVDKLYQEPAFGRADLAREVGVPEHVISRVVNAAFGKGFRNMLNEYRVVEAQDMLKNTGETITTIAFEVGFNSLASFNRAFRDIAGMSPSECRSKGD
ncbi:MAG: helix-turn-helix transcriptional regulator, partial [Pseudomonadota bacterium]|nr:helix-turn-helix transcriptional regulator [Pseudomonadota bacterium]